MEYQFKVGNWYFSDRYYTIKWEWKVWKYDVNISLTLILGELCDIRPNFIVSSFLYFFISLNELWDIFSLILTKYYIEY